jgi:hypothetical protein
MKHPPGGLEIIFAAILTLVACVASDCRAQDSSGCAAPSEIHEFCAKRRTFSAVVTFPQVRRWIRAKNPGSTNSSDRGRLTISCDHDGDEDNANRKPESDDNADGAKDGMTMLLWHQTIGTIGLAYAKLFDRAGLIFSMVPFDRAARRSASGTTPGTFAVLNRCELLKGHVEGLIFDWNQFVPLSFHGLMEEDASDWERTAAAPAPTSTDETNDRDLAAPTTDSRTAMSKVKAWDFSGIYEFEIEDEDCLIKRGFMKPYQQRSWDETVGHIQPDVRLRTRQQQKAQPNKYWESICPSRRGRLMVDAFAGDSPIYNLDHGSFVSHHIIGPKWDGQREFQSITPNGDTTGPTGGMFKIDGKIELDGSLEFYVFKPNVGKSGRLWPVAGSPKIWTTLHRFHAEKKLDVYCQLHIRPDCAKWKHQDWTGYLSKAWEETQKSRGLN